MFVTHESQHEFRNGDSGPKYLMQGPHTNFGLVQLQPGGSASAHVHNVMEENFYVLAGTPTFMVDGVEVAGEPGLFLHMEPGEAHYIENRSSEVALYVVTTAPFVEGGDKVNL